MDKQILNAINELTDYHSLGDPAKSLENIIPVEVKDFSSKECKAIGERAFKNMYTSLSGTVDGCVEAHMRGCPHDHMSEDCDCEVSMLEVEERPLVDYVSSILIEEIARLVHMECVDRKLDTFDYVEALDAAMAMALEEFGIEEDKE